MRVASARQNILQFAHAGQTRLAGMSAYEVRQHLKSAFESLGMDPMKMAVVQSDRALSIYPQTPEQSELVKTRAIGLMQAVANVAGELLEVEHKCVTPRISSDADAWLHRIPKITVCTKKTKDWAPWRAEKLTDDLKEQLTQAISDGITASLAPWGNCAILGKIILVDEGRPMVISHATGPRMLVRLGVKFITKWSVEGAIFVGEHTYLGNGRVMRLAPIAKTTDIQ